MGRRGRPGGVWFRVTHNSWHFKHRGRILNTHVKGDTPEGRERAERVAAVFRGLSDEELRTLDLPTLAAQVIRETVAALAGVPQVSAASPTTPPAPLSVQKPLYLAAVRHRLRPKTVKDIADRLGWLCRHFGGLTAGELDAVAVEQKAAGEGWGRGTVRQTLQVCQPFVRWCGRKDFVLRVPPAVYRGHECTISREEYERAVAASRGDFGPYLTLLWETGCRPGEGRAVTPDCVDWAGGLVRLAEWKNDKSGKPRLVILSPTALAVLRTQADKYRRGFLFRGSLGAPYSIHAVNRRWRQLREKGVVRASTVYVLRHAFITRALKEGIPAAKVAAMVGTSEQMINATYNHLSADIAHLKELAARLDAAG